MRLLAFNIKNYRSIIDTGWNSLAPDNITALIGQNESGKTSILEALNSFYTGEITDDVLRSDLSMPLVSCSFEINSEKFRSILPNKLFPKGLPELFDQLGYIKLTRIWDNDISSRIEIGESAVIKLYKDIERLKTEGEKKLQGKFEKLLVSAENATNEMGNAKLEKENVQEEFEQSSHKIPELKKAFQKADSEDQKNIIHKELESATRTNERLRTKLAKKSEIFESKSIKAKDLINKSKPARISFEAIINYDKANKALEESYCELDEVQKIYDSCTSEKEKRAARLKLDICKEMNVKANLSYNKARDELELKKAIAAKVYNGKDEKTAEREVHEEFEKDNEYYTLDDLGKELFENIPEFELFEDFSSLLPNRIDLEDVLTLNSSVEGYKAARNFLIISGLDASFFTQKNSRILKQKIENLNNEITITFQDYWRQNVGKRNKIKLNFELEHYDYNHPEKKGQPYLEFWIKDEHERLYPKQRSRGVRWFLSFYLELKATVRDLSSQNRLLLIDEPGLSLHARAQEDVLKVLEDIKSQIQIIYSTHSPHLVDLDKIYRLLAVQRAIEDDDKSETLIFDAKSLHAVSTDTLSPVYTLMGSKFTERQFIRQKNNVILKDISTFYYLSTFFKMVQFRKEIFFLPATEVSQVPILVNLLLGWKLDFIVLLNDDEKANNVYDELKLNICYNDTERANKILLKIDDLFDFEDLFSTIDFKKFVLHKRIGITEKNSVYIDNNNLSRSKLASDFVLHIQEEKIKFQDFDEETQGNVNSLISKISNMLY